MQYRKTLAYRNSLQYRVKGLGPVGFIDNQVYALIGNTYVLGDAIGVSLFDGSPSHTLSRTLPANGFDAALFGGTVIYDYTQYLVEHDGIYDGALGVPSLYNSDTYAYPHPGFDASAFGTAFIDFALRYLRPTGFVASAYGTPLCLGGTQTVFVTVGVRDGTFGTAFVSLGERQLYPHWWVDTYYGATEIGYTRYLDLDTGSVGIEPGGIGGATVLDNRQYLAPAGGDDLSQVSFFTFIDFAVRRVGAGVVEPDDGSKVPAPTIFNLTRFITLDYSPDQWNEGGVCTGFMLVYNVNRVVDLVLNGIKPPNHQVPDAHAIANNARILDLSAYGLTEEWGSALVAPAIRDVDALGWDGFTLGTFMVVYNLADQIVTIGADTSSVSDDAFVQNTRRYYDHIALDDQSAFGTAFVAPAIRSLIMDGSPLEDGGTIPDSHIVWFSAREVTPTPPVFPWEQFGVSALSFGSDHTLRPHGIPLAPAFGPDVFVRNNTPSLYAYWNADDAAPWGLPLVHHNPEYVDVGGNSITDGAFGALTSIDYRTKHVIAPGILAFRPNNLHSVRNVNPDPPGQQNIDFPSVGALSQYGTPSVRSMSIFASGFETQQIGSATARGNGIFPKGIIPHYDEAVGGQFGVPTLPSKQYAGPTGIHDGDIVPWPVVDPRTIWAPSGAPDGAHPGNPGGDELIDDYLLNNVLYTSQLTSARPWMNLHRVELKNRTLPPSSVGLDDGYGTPALTTRPIYAFPTGFRATKYGFASLNGGGEVDVYNTGSEDSYGRPTLSSPLPNPWYFRPPSIGDTLVFPTQDCQLFNRSLPITGIHADAYASPRVSRAPQYAEPAGAVRTVFGFDEGGFIDFRVRYQSPEGEDMLTMLYELGYFDERLRVDGRGFLGGGWGSENLTLGETLLAGLLSMERDPRLLVAVGYDHASVPAPTARGRNALTAIPGLGPLDEFGDAWGLPVAPGQIQPRGDEHALFGMAATTTVAYPTGWLDNAIEYDLSVGIGTIHVVIEAIGMVFDEHIGSAVPSHSIAPSIGVSGLDAAQFGAAVAMNMGSCGRQARALVGFDAAELGSPAVSG